MAQQKDDVWLFTTLHKTKSEVSFDKYWYCGKSISSQPSNCHRLFAAVIKWYIIWLCYGRVIVLIIIIIICYNTVSNIYICMFLIQVNSVVHTYTGTHWIGDWGQWILLLNFYTHSVCVCMCRYKEIKKKWHE